jgi:hypothetical protein
VIASTVLLMGCRPVEVPAELRDGAWMPVSVFEGTLRPYGKARRYLEFESSSISSYVCAYKNDVDMDFYRNSSRDCPVSGVNRFPPITVTRARPGLLEYRDMEATISCPPGKEDCRRSSIPLDWPILGAKGSSYEIHGDELVMWNNSGGAPAMDAVVRLRRVPRSDVHWR